MSSPYSSAPARAFWSRSVAQNWKATEVVAENSPFISIGDRVMSAGSCFAANIIPYLEISGLHYVRTERRYPGINAPPENLAYDKFSAAYGNIYTPRHLLQLLQRSLGLYQPSEFVWTEDKEFVDPFRPGLRYRARSLSEFNALTAQHLACTRRAVEEASVFIFTFGLTEAWISRADGAVLPACPGTVAAQFDPLCYEFHNFTVAEIVSDFAEIISIVRRLNSELRLVLTVSPAPLVATATDNHVLEASIYSKSVLRVAASEIAAAHQGVRYFPAYEIVTGTQAPDNFFEADRRNVTTRAVDEVMAAFFARTNLKVAQPTRHTHQVPKISQAVSQRLIAAECEEVMADRAAG